MLIGVDGFTSEGENVWVTISDGFRGSNACFLEILCDLEKGCLKVGSRLAVGALGMWNALAQQLYPEATHQRCWLQKTGNVFSHCPNRCVAKRRQICEQSGCYRPARRARQRSSPSPFIERYQDNPKAIAKLLEDRLALLAFSAFFAEHRVQLCTTNPNESILATARHSAQRTTILRDAHVLLGFACELGEEVAKSWRLDPTRRVQVLDGMTKKMVFR